MSVRGLYLFRQFGDQFAAVNVLRPYGAFNIALNRRDPGPDGTVGTGDDGPMVTIHDYDAAFRGSAFRWSSVDDTKPTFRTSRTRYRAMPSARRFEQGGGQPHESEDLPVKLVEVGLEDLHEPSLLA